MKFASTSIFIVTLTVTILVGAATSQQPKQDVTGSDDHPLFPNRMPGYTISSYEKQDFK